MCEVGDAVAFVGVTKSLVIDKEEPCVASRGGGIAHSKSQFPRLVSLMWHEGDIVSFVDITKGISTVKEESLLVPRGGGVLCSGS